MKRTTSEVKVQLPPHGTPPRPQAGSAACLICRKVMRAETAANRGGMCQGCYKNIRSSIALLKCDGAVRNAVEAGQIGVGHALKLSKLLPAEQKERLNTLLAASNSLKGHAKAKAQAAVVDPEKPKMRTRKEIAERLASHPSEASLLRWVLGEDIGAGERLIAHLAADVRAMEAD